MIVWRKLVNEGCNIFESEGCNIFESNRTRYAKVINEPLEKAVVV